MHYQRFLDTLYEEHIEELTYLIELRQTLLSDGDIPWPRLAEEEERILAHFDGLVIGSSNADKVVLNQLLAAPEDPTLCYIGIAHAVLANNTAFLNQVISKVDTSEPNVRQAISAALADWLNNDTSDEFKQTLSSIFDSANTQVALSIANTQAHRDNYISLILEKCQGLAKDFYPDYIRSLSRCPRDQAVTYLQPLMMDKSSNDRRRAAELCVRLGDKSTVEHLLHWQKTESWPVNLLAIISPDNALSVLSDKVAQSLVSRDFIYALAMIGTSSAVEIITELLNKEDTETHACFMALYLIFGSGPIRSSEKKALELAVLDATLLVHYSETPADWIAFVKRQPPLKSALRYGQPLGKAAIAMSLSDPLIPSALRYWLFLEAQFMGYLNTGENHTNFVDKQSKIISRLRSQ